MLTETRWPGSLQRMVRARRMITEAGGVWLRLELRITARLHVGIGLVTCMKGVPHPWWNVCRVDRISPEGLFGEATTVSIWRIRMGWWCASRPNDGTQRRRDENAPTATDAQSRRSLE